MPARRGKLFDVNGIALLDVGQHGSVFDDSRWNRLGIGALVAPAAQQLQWMNVERQIHRQGKPAQRAVGIGGDTKARRETGELVEDHHRTALLRRQFGQAADIKF